MRAAHLDFCQVQQECREELMRLADHCASDMRLEAKIFASPSPFEKSGAPLVNSAEALARAELGDVV